MENENAVNAVQENVVDSQENSNTEVVQTTENTSTDNHVQTEVSGKTEEVAIPQQGEKKTVQTAEENAKYAEIRRKAESEARDNMVKEMNIQWNDKKIETYSEYVQAQKEYKQQQEIQKMVEEQHVPEELAQRLYTLEQRDKERLEQESLTKAEREKQETQDKNVKEFLEEYPDINPDEIPAEVLAEGLKGKSLIDAYARYENKLLKQKIAELTKGQATKQVNEQNANSSTGSVTGNGAASDVYYSPEQVKTMTAEQILKNYDAVMESKKRWYK